MCVCVCVSVALFGSSLLPRSRTASFESAPRFRSASFPSMAWAQSRLCDRSGCWQPCDPLYRYQNEAYCSARCLLASGHWVRVSSPTSTTSLTRCPPSTGSLPSSASQTVSSEDTEPTPEDVLNEFLGTLGDTSTGCVLEPARSLSSCPERASVLNELVTGLLRENIRTGRRDQFWHDGCGPKPYTDQALRPDSVDQIRNPAYGPVLGSGQWLRIPMRHPGLAPDAPQRESRYGDKWTLELVRGYHRTRFEALATTTYLTDWSNRIVPMPGIMFDGFMRNGVNGFVQGVWFYLHWGHPWAPEPTEAVIEITVSESTIDKNNKWHMKYCAVGERAGARNRRVAIDAVHLPRRLLVDLQRMCTDIH